VALVVEVVEEAGRFQDKLHFKLYFCHPLGGGVPTGGGWIEVNS
jgi:hypothetical protein